VNGKKNTRQQSNINQNLQKNGKLMKKISII
jgi:hypothetical protein